MINISVNRVVEARGIANPRALMVQAGMPTAVAGKILKGKLTIFRQEYIEMLCKAFNCLPTDLFVWTPSSRSEDTKDNPLQAIRKSDSVKIPEILKDLPMDQLRKVEDLIRSFEN